jgi:hypothetical protein
MNIKTKFGWTITMAWIALWAFLLFQDWHKAHEMKFNEWGDFFAGAFAPLAFLWLVIGYFQQGEELSQNTEALKLQEKALQSQVKELQHSVEQQNISANALNKQSKLSGLMARLEAKTRLIDALGRKIVRVKDSRSAGKENQVNILIIEQEKHEDDINSLLSEIQELEKV